MFGHLPVDLLFVPEEQRKSGVGRQLVQSAEEEARRRGCRGVWLDIYSFSFQARGFYKRLGYEGHSGGKAAVMRPAKPR